jgi:hypothetical protein
MATLKEVIEGVCTILKGHSNDVYMEYEKIPVAEHEKIYAVTGISKMIFENGFFVNEGNYFDGNFNVRIRVLGSCDTAPDSLYEMLDTLIDRLDYGGFSLNRIEILSPVQDNALRRIVLECNVEISGKSEVLNELQS